MYNELVEYELNLFRDNLDLQRSTLQIIKSYKFPTV